jgi:dsDNA-specific endonuclease/ATPase MutS2
MKLIGKLECGQCGIPLDTFAIECPKCGEKRAVRQDGKKVLEVDVAHAGETVERALAKLNQAASESLAGAYRVLRVVHGYGSGHNHTHLIKEAVQKRLLALQERYGGKLIQDGNPGATQWQIGRGS